MTFCRVPFGDSDLGSRNWRERMKILNIGLTSGEWFNFVLESLL
jgi:hypothetical protein